MYERINFRVEPQHLKAMIRKSYYTNDDLRVQRPLTRLFNPKRHCKPRQMQVQICVLRENTGMKNKVTLFGGKKVFKRKIRRPTSIDDGGLYQLHARDRHANKDMGVGPGRPEHALLIKM